MSLQFLNNKEIDRNRWDALVKQFGNGRMYLLSSYLDATANNWSALIFGDYEYIMPLPFKSYFWKLIQKPYMPLFVQQLGIIGRSKIPIETRDTLILAARDQFAKLNLAFNHENGEINIAGFQTKQRTNFELDLSLAYSDIWSNYKQNLKRNLKNAQEEGLVFTEKANWNSLECFINDYSQPKDPTPSNFNTLKSIGHISISGFKNNIYEVRQGDNILAICMAPKFNNRITLLVPRSSHQGRELNAMAFLIDQIIQKHQGQKMILDFEGSMLPGVAKFYQQFGAKNKMYFVISA